MKPASSITKQALHWTPTGTHKWQRGLKWQLMVSEKRTTVHTVERLSLARGEAAKITQDRKH